jgi:hypothetical protein
VEVSSHTIQQLSFAIRSCWAPFHIRNSSSTEHVNLNSSHLWLTAILGRYLVRWCDGNMGIYASIIGIGPFFENAAGIEPLFENAATVADGCLASLRSTASQLKRLISRLFSGSYCGVAALPRGLIDGCATGRRAAPQDHCNMSRWHEFLQFDWKQLIRHPSKTMA